MTPEEEGRQEHRPASDASGDTSVGRLAYTRLPGRRETARKPSAANQSALLALVSVFAVLSILAYRHSSAPSPAPEESAPAPAASVPAALAPLPALPPPARMPLYLGTSVAARPHPEPDLSGMKYYAAYYDPAVDGYPVAGDFIDVVVDGKPSRMPLKSAVRPGERKLIIVMPPDSLPHKIEMRPVYDLGPDGLVQVTDTILDDGRGNKVYISRSPVDSIIQRRGDTPRRLKLKN